MTVTHPLAMLTGEEIDAAVAAVKATGRLAEQALRRLAGDAAQA